MLLTPSRLRFLLSAGVLFLMMHFDPASAQTYQVTQSFDLDIEYTGQEDFLELFQDEVSGPIPLGFSFEFYGNTYTEVYASANGFLTFDPFSGPGSGGGDFIPSPSDPNNLIAGVWTQNQDYGGNTPVQLYYITEGAAPNRKFRIEFFDANEECDAYAYYQFKLFEGSNIIEIHLDYWDGDFACNPATQGIEDSTGTEAAFLPGRNADYWFASGEVTTFTPLQENDASVASNISTYCDGLQDIESIISNVGSNTINTVTVDWSWNGVLQTPVTYTNPIPPGGNVLVTLGQQTLTFGDQDTLLVSTSFPNGVPDPNPANDAVESYVNVGLYGTYTIGGTSPDYATFSDAVAALETLGICDTVIFNVRDGLYNEQFDIGLFAGAFGDNQVIFQSESGDSTAVQVFFQSDPFDPGTNYVVKLDGARNITFKGMTFQNTGTGNFARVFLVANDAQEIAWQNNVLIGKQFASQSTGFSLIYLMSEANDFLIENNVFKFGAFQIYQYPETDPGDIIIFVNEFPNENNASNFSANLNNPDPGEDQAIVSGTVVRGNTFENFAHFGIQLWYVESPIIEHNQFTCPNNSTETGIAIYDAVGDSLSISSNTLYLNAADDGIFLNVCSLSGESRIANNAVYIDGFAASRGISLDAVDTLGVYFNSVYLANNNPLAAAIEIDNCNSLDIRNNIFLNKGSGYAVVTDAFEPTTSMDYNNLFVSGSYLANNTSGSQYFDFESWQDGSDWEANGLNLDPLFADTFNLRTQQALLNKRGTPIPGIVEDFEGDQRDPAFPDIGADEFVPPNDEITILGLTSPGIFCDQVQDVIVEVFNAGSNQVSGFQVEWTLDGISQAPASSVTLLDTVGGIGATTQQVNLGSIALTAGVQYALKIWTALPNGNPDADPSNDTLQIIYQLPLNGTYTIGSAPSDFLTIEEAVRTLDTAGMCGPVRLEFKPGTYDQHVVIFPIDGLSETNRLTITSQSGDTSDTKIRYIVPISDNEEAIFQLEDADYITISNLGLYVDGNFYHRPVWLNGSTRGVRIEGNHFLGKSNITSGGETIYGIGKSGDLDLVIRNNHFTGSSHGVYIRGVDAQDRFSNITVEGNTFLNQNSRFISIEYGNHISINKNALYRNAGPGKPYFMFLGYNGGLTTISNNNVIAETPAFGVYLNNMNTANTNSITRVFNNMIRTEESGYGILFSNSYRLECYYNNIHNPYLNNFANAFRSSSSDTLDIRNNIFYSEQGPAMSIAFSTNQVTSDHNNILSNGFTQVGTWMGSYSTLADWQTASGQDLNSIAIDPQFYSATDLHVQEPLLNQAATPVAGITTDIDGESRDAVMPDIGADEIGVNMHDIALFAIFPEMPVPAGNQDITVVVRNVGSNAVTSFNVNYTFNGTPGSVFNYSGTLAPLSNDTLTIGTESFDFGVSNSILAWTDSPNGTMDSDAANDTLLAQDLYTSLSGVLTIGGVSPDFPTIQSAIDQIELAGTIGDVTLQLRNGTYQEAIVLDCATCFTCGNHVTFESESGNPEDVVWTTDGNAVPLQILGADGLRFRNLTIQSASTAFAHAIVMNNGSACNIFEGNRIVGQSTSSSFPNQSVVYSASGPDHNNQFIQNTIVNGSYGLYLAGNSGEYEEHTVVTGNIFEDQYFRPVYLYRQHAPKVMDNAISTGIATINSHSAITLIDCSDSLMVTGNEILLGGTTSDGILLNNCIATAETQSLIANNMVHVGGGAFSTGINFFSVDYARIYHNNIHVVGTQSTSLGIYLNGGSSPVEILNNVIVNASGGDACYFQNGFTNGVSDYNDLFVTGPTLIFSGGTDYADLATWQSQGYDGNSLSIDPQFVAPDDLHVLNSMLDNAGTPVPAVTTDFDGELRDPVTPDIGADEFDLFTDDVGIISINYPVQPFPAGIQTVFIKFINNGDDTLTSMVVNHTINGDTMPTYNWTGLLPSGETYDSLDIGTYDFLPDSTHTIKVWVSNPNGMTDGLAANDTLEVGGLYPGLSGVYTIGPPNQQDPPDFESIGDAVRVLNIGGAADAVTLNIRQGTYVDTIHISDFPGSGCDRPVIFQSASQDSSTVIIENFFLDQYPVIIDDADGVIFQHLTIKTTNASYPIAIYLGGDNGANCNTIQNCHIIGWPTTFFNFNNAVIFDESGFDWGNVYQNNLIEEGSHAINLTHSGDALSGTKVLNNQIFNYSSRGIYAVGHNGMQIEGNELRSDQGYSNLTGLFMDECDSAVVIRNNHVLLEDGRYGMLIYDLRAESGAPASIVNNFVSVGTDANCFGIAVERSGFVNVHHNNVLNRSTRATYTSSNTAMRINDGDSLDLRNNIFFGAGPQTIAIQSFNAPSYRHIDHNNYFANASFLGYWDSSDVSDLAAWQAATGDDANSIAANPLFVSDLDLHVGLVLLNAAGDPTVGVTEDIDGELRGTPPDIGADEFDPPASDDAGIFAFMGPVAPFADGVQQVLIAIKNFGGNPLTSANVRWLVNGFEQTQYAWTGNLSPGACDTVTIGTFDFLPYQKHDLVFWTEQPNGVPDSTLVNDTLYLDNLYPALNGSYTVGGVLPDFNLFSQLEDALNRGGIIGDVDFRVRPGYYAEQLEIIDFPRINPAHSVLFESETGEANDVTLIRNFNGPNYTVLVDAADNVAFSNMRLESTRGIVVNVSGGSENFTLDSVILVGRENGFGSNDALIFSPSSSENGLTVTNSTFIDGASGILITGSNGNKEVNTRIEHNTFKGQDAISISATSQSGIVISGNEIDTEEENQNIGIYLLDCDDSLTVAKNSILMPANGTGLYIEASEMDGPGLGRVVNNFIHIQGTLESRGISLDRSRRIEFYYNSVLISNTDEDSYPIEVFSTSSNLLNLENNIFANTGGGLSFYSFYNTNFVDFDHNNFYTTGPVLARIGGIYADLTALQINTGNNLNSISVDPIFLSDDAPAVSQVQLDGAGKAIIGITDDIAGDPRDAGLPDIGADEFTPVANDIAVVQLVAPETFCGLSTSEDVTIRLQNRGSVAQSGFNVSYLLNGNLVTENIGGLSIPAGDVADFTFATQVDLGQIGMYEFTAFSSLATDERTDSDTITQVVEHIPQLVQGVSNMLPIDGSMEVDKPLSLSWGPAPNATLYDVYVWPTGTTQPGSPQISNIAQINTSYNTNISYGTAYNWQVVAKNVCDQMVGGPVQSFTVRELPDLVVDTVIVPPTAFSGQQIQFEWQTRNLGPGATQSQLWTDAVYLSQDATLNTTFDIYLGGTQNLTALDSGISYTNTITLTLPEVINGNYYVFVAADRFNNLLETNNANNSERTPEPMMITLSPAPDLKVTSVTTPSNVFSGQPFPVTYTVKNEGDGPTDETSWQDAIREKPDEIADASGNDLRIVYHTGDLEPDSSYTVNTFAEFPIETEGVRFIGVTTDRNGDVFEAIANNNNTGVSDSIEVIILPPADLVVLPFSMPDTVSNNEFISIPVQIVNQGGSAGIPDPNYFENRFYFSQSPVYNPNFLVSTWVNYSNEVLEPNDTLTLTSQIIVPRDISGTYYNYFHVDLSDNIFEYTFEDNNLYQLDTTTFVANPDLVPLDAAFPPGEFAGRTINVSWIERNLGPGQLTVARYKTHIYLSADSILNEENAILLQSVSTITGLNGVPDILGVGDTIFQNANVNLPIDQFGDLFIHIHTDYFQRVLESDLDSNNVLTVPITIQPVPVPDLVPTQLTVPDTVFAGSAFNATFTIQNQGIVDASLTGGIDAIYVSFSPTWQPEFAELLLEIPQNGEIEADSSQLTSVSLPIDLNTVSNQYYLYLEVDADDALYEAAGETNNILRSDPFFVKPYPPTDLIIDAFMTELDTVVSGALVPATARMENIGPGVTRSGSWSNGVFLSSDMVLDTMIDIRIADISYAEGFLEGGMQKNFDAGFQIPDGLTGTYYVFMYADYSDINKDIDRSNNAALLRDTTNQPTQIHIQLADYPDLVVSNVVAPTTVISGGNFEVQIELGNIGSGTANQATHRLYVSTDDEINAGDIVLKEFVSPMIDTNSVWADTFVTFLPASYDGNYFFLIKLDIQDVLFENMGEGNNEISRVVEALLAPPSDLYVQTIALPDSIIAGDEATVEWTTINQGAFPANGNLREIVYLSRDSIWDVNDQLLGLVDDAVYMPPAATRSASVSGPVQGVREESYFAIVQTDARDNINESDEDNNYATSLDQMDVQFKELIVNEWKSDTIGNDEFIYYKLELGANLANDAAIITLKGDSINGQNEIYIKYGEAPTISDFDFGFEFPFSGNQQATIPNIIPGTYYILVLGKSPATHQPFEIIAEPIGTSIQRITPKRGSNSGYVTMRIFGTKLDSLEYVQISKQDTSTSEYIFLRADTFFNVSPELVIARFDLRGMPLDTYDVECVRPDGIMGWLRQGFEIIDGDPGTLALDWVIAPARVLAGRAAPIQVKVDVRNVGTTDLVDEAFKLYGVVFTEIFASLEDYENGIPIPNREVIVEDETGLPGILSPGNLRTYYLYVPSNGSRLFVISY